MRKAVILTAVDQGGVAIAVPSVVHDHARGLHERVADGRSNKSKSGFFQGAAHGFGLWRNRRDFAAVLEMIDLGHAANKRPKKLHRVLQRQPGSGIAPGSVEFQAVSNDTRIEHQRLDFFIAHLRQTLCIKAKQDLPIMLAFA